jgi:trimethylamine:corrinoid methyltransferase-like protein
MQLRIRSSATLFSDADLQRLLEQALVVWRQTPFRVHGSDEVCDLLRTFGCRVDGECVGFPQAVIDKVLARCEHERRAWQSRPSVPTEAPAHIGVFSHGQALHICDVETNRLREATTADLASWCHFVEALGIRERAHPTFIPTDGPIATADFRAFATVLLNSSRPYRVSVYSAAMLPFFIEACATAKGSLEAVRADPVFAAKAWVTSPFMLDRENLDIAMGARRLLGRPVEFGQMPVAAASTPVTVAGALVQNTAESLAISALRLAIDDLPHGITGSSAMMDMRHGFPRQIGPDLFLHYLAGREMDDYLYRGERGAHGWGWCGAGAATVCAQSVLEKALGFGMAMAMGVRSFGVGCLAFSDVGSPTQLLLDLELVAYARALLREVSADDEHVGLETILEVAPRGGRYLETLHTASLFREECWLPSLCDFRAFMAWAHQPNDIIAKASTQAAAIWRDAPNPCPLTAAQQTHLRQLLAEADRVAGAAVP